LDMCRSRGVVGDTNPDGFSPRQACITIENSLIEQEVSWSGSRANVILSGESSSCVDSGTFLTIGSVALRVTMRCEPCSHGANLANVQVVRLRNIARYLAVVISCGRVSSGDLAGVQPKVFAATPEDFRTRCAWAIDSIPKGRVVSSVEFLKAVGASASYARALPRWLNYAKASDQPVHRVLTATLAAPSWAPDALHRLTNEGVELGELSYAQFPLTQQLWFEHINYRTESRPPTTNIVNTEICGPQDSAPTLF
jgi:alkylated DNA nucleotide flippase Atl1